MIQMPLSLPWIKVLASFIRFEKCQIFKICLVSLSTVKNLNRELPTVGSTYQSRVSLRKSLRIRSVIPVNYHYITVLCI